MDRDTIAETIFDRMAAPYGDAITPALTQQLRIQSNLAAEDILARRDHIRELSKLPLRHRLAAMRTDDLNRAG